MTENQTSNSETLNPVSSALDKALSEGRFTDAARELLNDEQPAVQEQEIETPVAEAEEQPEETQEQAEAEEEVLSHEETAEKTDSEHEDNSAKGYLKRIDKLTATKYKLKEELEAKEAEIRALKEQKAATPEPEARIPEFSSFAESIQTEADLIKANDEALEVILWTDENPEGGIVTIDGKDVEITAEKARAMRKQAMVRRARELPQRAQWLMANDAAKADAAKKWDWVNKPDTEEYRMAQNLLSRAPQLKKSADYPMFLGYMVMGLKAEKSATAKPAATTIKKAPPVPAVSSSLPTKTPSAARESDAKQRFMSSKHSDDGSLTSYIREAFV